MRATHLLLFTSALLSACADVPTEAIDSPGPSFITADFQEDNVHTWVGLIALYDANDEFLGRCSGSLISATVFLTAGHCIEGASSARIWFAQDAGAHFDETTELDPVTGYPHTCLPQAAPCVTSHEMYNYGWVGFVDFTNYDPKDVAIVILDSPVTTVGFGELAPVGTLDGWATGPGKPGVNLTITGYGISRVLPAEVDHRERLMANVSLINLRSAQNAGFMVQVSSNRGNGRGGVCFGDSGGPLLYEGQIVGVASVNLNPTCNGGSTLFYRIDQAAVQTWIANPS